MFFKDISDDLKNALIAKSNIFVMPSIIHKTSVEGFGIAYVEAAQYRYPISWWERWWRIRCY